MKVWIAGLLLVIFGVAAWFYFEAAAPPQPAEAPAIPPAVSEAEPPAAEPPAAEPDPEPIVQKRTPNVPELAALPLPSLPESDPLASETLYGLFGEAESLRYFVSEDIISRAVANIDALGSRQVPEQIQAVRGPQDQFLAVADEAPATVIRNEVGDPIPQFHSDPGNAERYTPYVEMLESVDPQTFVALYRSQYPLFQEAWRQLGYTDGDFNDRLVEVIDELLATPEVDEPLHLVKPEAFYLFADEDLEALPAGQKTLIRMGSENAARVKSWLAAVRAAL